MQYTIHHNGGSIEVTQNQQVNGGLWVPLGAYDLVPGQSHRVTLSQSGATGNAVADAVRFVRVGDIKVVSADAIRFVKNDAENASYMLWDHLFTPKKLVDSSSTVTWDASLTPYGVMESELGSAVQSLRLPGQYVDEENGRGTSGLTHPLYYNFHRDYDPAIGRYVQTDPIGLAGGMNTYAYANGNPTKYSDPTGKVAVVDDAVIITGLVVSAGIVWCIETKCGEAFANWVMSQFDDDEPTSVGPIVTPNENSVDTENCDSECEALQEADISTCRGIARVRGSRAGAKCYAQASERYAACLAGRPIPPLNTWNN